MTTLKEIQDLMQTASDKAVELVKSEALKILQADPDLDEFVMAMGGCFFTYKDGSKYDMLRLTDEEAEEIYDTEDDYHGRCQDGIIHDREIHKEFFDMVDELDDDFKVCGYPVRFTATSNEVHAW